MRSLPSMVRRLFVPIFSGMVLFFGPLVRSQDGVVPSTNDGVAVQLGGDAARNSQATLEPAVVPAETGPTLTLRTEATQTDAAESTGVPASSADGAHDAGPADTAAGADQASGLEPAADPVTNTEVTVDPAAFNGITPGVSTMEEVRKAWGEPTAQVEQDGDLLHLYAVGPFTRVETHFRDGRVMGIVVHLEKAYPAMLVAEHLQLSNVRPVLVSDPQGMVIGQAFPEKGVLFGFAPSGTAGKASMSVTQIV
ncbi:MAG: hypothetical protein GYA33_11640, partial [Thermogutta sp.]|nr:hypothetical protein [Thermogutta sp.]